jgi:hypothetical protein
MKKLSRNGNKSRVVNFVQSFLTHLEFFEIDQRKVFSNQFFIEVLRLVHFIQQRSLVLQYFQVDRLISV